MIPVGIFARPARASETKTRLAPVLGAEGAAALYASFVIDTLARCSDRPAFVFAAGDPRDPDLTRAIGQVPARAQVDGDLGARMAAALGELLDDRAGALLVGTDSPTLPPAYLRLAEQALESHDVVIGPAADRGYYLVGAARRVPPIFQGIRWSTPSVLHDTLARARAEGLRVSVLPPWYDVDTPDDLRLLRAHLSVRPRDAPASARSLGLL